MHTSRCEFNFLESISRANPSLNIRFATLSDYFKAVRASEPRVSIYEGDFYPYITQDGYSRRTWTGFYSSRPALKKKIFETHSLLRAAEISAALIQREGVRSSRSIEALNQNAITGTCTNKVSEDYLKNLEEDILHSEEIIRDSFVKILRPSLKPLSFSETYKAFVIYNPVNWTRKELLWIKSDYMHAVMYSSTGKVIPSQSVPYLTGYKIYFLVVLRSLSFTTIFRSDRGADCDGCSEVSLVSQRTTVSNGLYTLVFKEGFISKISANGIDIEVNSTLAQYDSTSSGPSTFEPKVSYI